MQLKQEELDKILIATSAVIPVFGFEEWHYTNLSGILLYSEYFIERQDLLRKKHPELYKMLVICFNQK